MAVVASYTISVRQVTFASFQVFFTDTSTGNPDQWLWDFGDGYCSTEQNPEHWYYGRWDVDEGKFSGAIEYASGEQVIYNVRMTAWKNGVQVVPDNPNPASLSIFYHDDDGFASQTEAQNALTASLPWEDWAVSQPILRTGTAIKYHMMDSTNNWEYGVSYSDMTLAFEDYPVATHVAWMEMLRADCRYGVKKYIAETDDDWYAIRMGKWDIGSNNFDQNVIGLKIANTELYYQAFSMESYLGDASTTQIRTVDAYGFERALILGGLAYKGWIVDPTYPRTQVWQVPSTDDISRASGQIEPNPSILERPPLLYGGIKEAYFEDGWENEKYLYIEQRSPFPCAIQFLDVYAECANE